MMILRRFICSLLGHRWKWYWGCENNYGRQCGRCYECVEDGCR